MDEVLTRALDHAAGDRQARSKKFVIAHVVAVAVEVGCNVPQFLGVLSLQFRFVMLCRMVRHQYCQSHYLANIREPMDDDLVTLGSGVSKIVYAGHQLCRWRLGR